MKKITLVLSFIVTAFSTQVFAQTATTNPTTGSDEVTLNVKLYPIINIEVASDQKTVDLVYDDIADYTGGVSNLKENHLKVNSTGGFTVRVKASATQFTNADTDNTKTLDTNIIKLTAAAGTGATAGATVASDLALSTTAAPLISNSVGGFGQYFDVTYAAAGGLLDHYKKQDGQAYTEFTTTVTYEIVAN